MGKEPAGLRRWRLAHRKHKRKRKVYVMPRRRRRVRRYGRKGKGRKSSKAIPLIQTAIIAYPIWQAYELHGLTKTLPAQISVNLTGFNPMNNSFNKDTAIKVAGALLLTQLVGSKIASRTGANRLMKKLSMGYLKVA